MSQIEEMAKKIDDLQSYISFLMAQLPQAPSSFEDFVAGTAKAFDLTIWEAGIRAEIAKQEQAKADAKFQPQIAALQSQINILRANQK